MFIFIGMYRLSLLGALVVYACVICAIACELIYIYIQTTMASHHHIILPGGAVYLLASCHAAYVVCHVACGAFRR